MMLNNPHQYAREQAHIEHLEARGFDDQSAPA
jgi:hypothetical protein